MLIRIYDPKSNSASNRATEEMGAKFRKQDLFDSDPDPDSDWNGLFIIMSETNGKPLSVSVRLGKGSTYCV